MNDLSLNLQSPVRPTPPKRPAALKAFCICLVCAMLTPPMLLAEPAPRAKGMDVANVLIDAQGEQIVQGALRFLASQQAPSGAWSESKSPVAVTGYTLMAFLSAGQLPGEGEHGKTVNRGVQYLLNCVGDDGYISSAGAAAGKKSSNMYDHGIASIALGEVYGQTKDALVRAKLEKIIKLTLSAQNKQGGWRYSPKPNDADISVTVLQVVALRAAKNGGIDVPQEAIDKAVSYVRSCAVAKNGGFSYQSRGGDAGFARTAAAIYSLQVCGQYDDPLIAPASEYLNKNRDSRQWFTYGHFYAAPAQYMIGGETWKNWYGWMSKKLKDTVKQKGDQFYWDPIDGQVNNIYATACYTMILAMPYHYIPLYQR